jgi:hypothetical protein
MRENMKFFLPALFIRIYLASALGQNYSAKTIYPNSDMARFYFVPVIVRIFEQLFDSQPKPPIFSDYE